MTGFSVARLRRALHRHGVWGCLKLSLVGIYQLLCNSLPGRRAYNREYLREQLDFDRKLNIETWHRVELRDLGIHSDESSFGTDHEPSAVRFVTRFLNQLSIDFRNFTFIDLGAGMGRSVFIAASSEPFRRCVGIEFSRDLHRRAMENLGTCRREELKCIDIEFLCGDAGAYTFPSDPLVVHLYNPFGSPVLQKVVNRIDASVCALDREVYVLYRNSSDTNQECLTVFRKSKSLSRIWSENKEFLTIWVHRPATADGAELAG